MKSLQDLKCGFLLASGSPCWENVTITDLLELLVKPLLDSPQQEDSLIEYNSILTHPGFWLNLNLVCCFLFELHYSAGC